MQQLACAIASSALEGTDIRLLDACGCSAHLLNLCGSETAEKSIALRVKQNWRLFPQYTECDHWGRERGVPKAAAGVML